MKSHILLTISIVSVALLGASMADAAKPPKPVKHLDKLDCAAGEIAKFDGASWSCAEDIHTDTSAATECAAGEVLLGDDSCAEINPPQPTGALYLADGSGNRIGAMVNWGNPLGWPGSAIFLTSTGYFSHVHVRSGFIRTVQLAYERPGCLGEPYAMGNPIPIHFGQGEVFAGFTASGSKDLFSSKEVGVINTPDIQSRSDENGCSEHTPDPTDDVIPIVPNDPNVTGLSVTSFPAPIILRQ